MGSEALVSDEHRSQQRVATRRISLCYFRPSLSPNFRAPTRTTRISFLYNQNSSRHGALSLGVGRHRSRRYDATRRRSLCNLRPSSGLAGVLIGTPRTHLFYKERALRQDALDFDEHRSRRHGATRLALLLPGFPGSDISRVPVTTSRTVWTTLNNRDVTLVWSVLKHPT